MDVEHSWGAGDGSRLLCDAGFRASEASWLSASLSPYRCGAGGCDSTEYWTNQADLHDEVQPFMEHPGQSLEQLGILEGDHLLMKRFPEVRGKGRLEEALAVCEIAALQQQVPFRRDAVVKVLEDQFRRDKALSLELWQVCLRCSV